MVAEAQEIMAHAGRWGGGHLGVECQVASPATLSSLGPSPPLHSLSALNLPRSSPLPSPSSGSLV